jgi:hypothetical protein
MIKRVLTTIVACLPSKPVRVSLVGECRCYLQSQLGLTSFPLVLLVDGVRYRRAATTELHARYVTGDGRRWNELLMVIKDQKEAL